MNETILGPTVFQESILSFCRKWFLKKLKPEGKFLNFFIINAVYKSGNSNVHLTFTSVNLLFCDVVTGLYYSSLSKIILLIILLKCRSASLTDGLGGQIGICAVYVCIFCWWPRTTCRAFPWQDKCMLVMVECVFTCSEMLLVDLWLFVVNLFCVDMTKKC